MATNDAISLGQFTKGITNLKNYTDEIANNKLDKTLLDGGTTGQILSKKSDANNDVEWTDPEIKVINPSNLQEFLTMTSENGLYYVPETCNVSIDEFDVSTSARGDIRSYSLCGLNEVIDEYYYGKKYINYNQYLYFYYDSETEKITDLVILMEYISSIEDAVNILPSKAYVDNKVAGIVDSAPDALNTLNELAAALGDDANFATTVTNSLSNKANINHTHNNYVEKAYSDIYVDTKLMSTANSKGDSLAFESGEGIQLSIGASDNAEFSVKVNNAGIRSISTGTTDGTISVNTNGITTDVEVKNVATKEYVDDKSIDITESNYSTTYTTINKYPYSDLMVSDSFIYIYPSTTPTFSIRLKEKPLNNQTVNLSCNNSIMSLSSTTLTFTETNYNTPQTITLTLSSTSNIDGDQFIVSISSEHYYKDITFEYHNEQAQSNIIAYDFFDEASNNTLVNTGTGGSKYNATINTSFGNTAEFTSKGLSLHKNAYISIPWAADSSSGSWTVEMVISELVYGGTTTYGRVYRSNTDTPSMYYSKTLGWRIKIGATKALTSSTDTQYIVDKTIVLKYDNGTCSVKVGDSEYISNTMNIENTGFYIGNNDSSKSYYFDTLTISEFRVYNYAK